VKPVADVDGVTHFNTKFMFSRGHLSRFLKLPVFAACTPQVSISLILD
jgi:hypothetical protein